jgi:hypothetical protein
MSHLRRSPRDSVSGTRDKRDKKIRELRAQGTPFREIAALVGCSSATAQRVAVRGAALAGLVPVSTEAVEVAAMIEHELWTDTFRSSDTVMDNRCYP